MLYLHFLVALKREVESHLASSLFFLRRHQPCESPVLYSADGASIYFWCQKIVIYIDEKGRVPTSLIDGIIHR